MALDSWDTPTFFNLGLRVFVVFNMTVRTRSWNTAKILHESWIILWRHNWILPSLHFLQDQKGLCAHFFHEKSVAKANIKGVTWQNTLRIVVLWSYESTTCHVTKYSTISGVFLLRVPGSPPNRHCKYREDRGRGCTFFSPWSRSKTCFKFRKKNNSKKLLPAQTKRRRTWCFQPQPSTSSVAPHKTQNRLN